MVDLVARDDHGDCCTMLRPGGGEPVTGQGVGPVTGKDFAAEVRLDHCPSRSSNLCKALSVPGPAASVNASWGSDLGLERPDAPLGQTRPLLTCQSQAQFPLLHHTKLGAFFLIFAARQAFGSFAFPSQSQFRCTFIPFQACSPSPRRAPISRPRNGC